MSFDLAKIRLDRTSAMSNGGWNCDAYPELEPLNAHSRIVVAQLKGPGVVTGFHTTMHGVYEQALPDEYRQAIAARGIVLEISYNGAESPAVRVPLGDFFADGCAGKADYFTSLYVEKAPKAYNCFIPMPFEGSATVALCNETPYDLMNYSFVEWESLPCWDGSLGYFYASSQHRRFQLDCDTSLPLFHVKGPGHLVGRSMSVTTADPLFKDFHFVMEANNEVRLDGATMPQIDYLGTEDSFGFSWGFQEKFCGLYNGMNHIRSGDDGPQELSIYRFLGQNAIRFSESLDWQIDWSHERGFRQNPDFCRDIDQRQRDNGTWVQLDSVFYWYQQHPLPFSHEALPDYESRCLSGGQDTL